MNIDKLLELPNAAAPIEAEQPALLLLEDHSKKDNVFPKANAATLQFPTDRWGCCSSLKKEIIKTAGRCAGHADKMTIFRDTLVELMAHVEDKDAEATYRKSVLCAS